MLRNKSVSTIGRPEFINLSQDAINPGISKCDIKVLYLGQNRNGSYIDRQAAERMAETLPGTPIVGAYRKDVDDFGDHGEILKIENGKVEISCSTVPYGFVSPDAKIWFKNFNDIDEFGNAVERTYLMTTGYLWTGQYPEIERCVSEGMGQSMELDPKTLDGHYAEDYSSGIEFFIINDATFTKLCVLGNDVEPCFEGASVTEDSVSSQFSNNSGFVRSLFSMMEELKDVLSNDEGGCNMSENSHAVEEAVEESILEDDVESDVEFKKDERPNDDGVDENEDDSSDGDDKQPKDEKSADEQPEDDKKPETESSCDEDKKKFELLSEEFSKLSEECASLKETIESLKTENASLREFKAERENADKDALIGKYHMLSDEDKADVIERKSEYTLDEIESKLALIYVKKNVDFDTIDGHAEEHDGNEPVSTFSLNIQSESVDDVDPMLAALRETSNLY